MLAFLNTLAVSFGCIDHDCTCAEHKPKPVLHEIEIEDSPALPRRRRVFSFSKKSILEFTANKNQTPSSSHLSTPRTVASQNLNDDNATPTIYVTPSEDEVSERLRDSIPADPNEPGMNYYSPLPDLVGDIGNMTPGGSINPNTILRQRINSFDEQLRRFSVTSLENSLGMDQPKSLYERRVTSARLLENIDLSELDSPNSTRTIHRNFGKENSSLEIDENTWNNYGEELKVLADNYALNYKMNQQLKKYENLKMVFGVTFSCYIITKLISAMIGK